MRFFTGGAGPRVIRRVPPTMFWDAVRGLTTTLPDRDMHGHDNGRCDDFFVWFVTN